MIDQPQIKMKQLLNDHAHGKLPMNELEKECAYWFLDCFSEINPKAYPTEPREYLDYKNLSYEKKQKIGNEFFFQPVIKNYLEVKERIKNENQANVFKLKQFASYIPEGDFVAKSKFKEKLQDFEYKDYA